MHLLWLLMLQRENGKLPDKFSMVETNKENITVEVIKQAESGDGVVVRLYDAHNMASKPTVKFNFQVKEAYIVNLLEKNRKSLISIITL